MVLGSLVNSNDPGSSASSDRGPTVTSLSIRNRGKATDAFGLLSITGVILEADDSEPKVEVSFGGYGRCLNPDEALGPRSEEGTRIVEFHLLTHLVPNGVQVVNAALITD